MMLGDEAQFEYEVTGDDCQNFAKLSGDWNPLHTDVEYARSTIYGHQVLHGAFAAGLISRLAGMHLPGKECLLHGLKLRFIEPILPPVVLRVIGRITSASRQGGRVEAIVVDSHSGRSYVEASYEFGFHRMANRKISRIDKAVAVSNSKSLVLVTGSSGGLGGALLNRLGAYGQAVMRDEISGRIELEALSELVTHTELTGIVHCGWPPPDNQKFINLYDSQNAINEQVAGPLRDIQALSALIAKYGKKGAPLILIGSTATKPGRHYYRKPLYSIAKSMIPTIVEVLAMELAPKDKRCFGVIFDALDGGMNGAISESARVANADRSPWGEVASLDDAAEQIIWLLQNEGKLISGATLTLSAGSIP